MRACVDFGNRLFGHDRKIVINLARANLTGWHDILLAGAVLVVILAVARSWLGDQPWRIAAWAAFGVGAGAGMGVRRLLAARIAFHSYDGLLAADAMQPSLRRRYMVAWHGIAIVILTAVTLLARPSLIVISALAYLLGVFLGALVSRLAVERAAFGKATTGWNVRKWLRHPGAGVAAALTLLASLFPAHTLETKGVLAVIGMEAVLFALMLTPVEQDIVRFKAISGYGPWRMVVDYSFGLLLFAGVAAPACWFACGPVPAGIVLTVSGVMLLLVAMRVLTYCVHDKRFADLLISIFAGLLMLVGYSMLVFLPFLIVAILWKLQRRAAEKTWLLA